MGTCAGEMRSQPAQVDVSADGSGFVAGLAWSGWGASPTSAYGTRSYTNLVP